MKLNYLFLIVFIAILGCKSSHSNKGYDGMSGATKIVNMLHYPEEKHLENVTQITFGGDNAEAYWSFDSSKLVFQSNNKAWGLECDQIFIMDASKPLDSTEVPTSV